MLGALLCIWKSDAWGRKRLLILSGFLFTVSSIGTGLAATFFIYNSWRIIGGVAIGIALNLSPMYISEMAPSHLRESWCLSITIDHVRCSCAQVANWQISLIDQQMPLNATPK
jgi:MFS family permease